jgi:hypothetical protein
MREHQNEGIEPVIKEGELKEVMDEKIESVCFMREAKCRVIWRGIRLW